jgi:cephalosporin-C deacetylase-like acetyl esterase
MMSLGLLLLCPALPAAAQTPAPVLDGKLDDAYWRQTPVHRLEPDQPGVPAETGGDIRAVIHGRYLLIAARLPEPSGRVTARVTGRHPDWEEEDMLQITVGPDIGSTDRVVRINPFGALTTQRDGQEVYPNSHRYLVATSVSESEWTLEFAFPLNLVGAPGPEPILLSVQRIRAMRPGTPQLRWRWPKFDPVTKVAVDRSVPWDAPAPECRPALLGNPAPPLLAGQSPIPPATAGWNDAPWTSVPAWTLPLNLPGSPAPKLRTEVKAIHDGETLSILARAEEPDAPIATVTEHDGRVERDDSFHVYLAVSGSSYAQISVNASGYLYDAAGKTGGPRISRPRADWQSGAKVTTRRGPGFWTARLDIPLENVLNILGEPKTQTNLRVLFARVRPGRRGVLSETSALPAMSGQTMLAPIRYQRLNLTGAAPSTLPQVSPPPAPPALDTQVWSPTERQQRRPAGMVEANLRARTIASLQSEAKSWSAIQTRQQWEQFREPRVAALRRFLGDFPARTPLNTKVGKEFQGPGYRRLDIVYQSRPGLWIAANLYLPESPRGRIPAFVIVPSHHRPRSQMELQDMGILWARSGSAVLVADNLGHGERIQTYPWNREGYHARYTLGLQLYAAGESLIKWMVWDIMRSVDLLTSRPEVDPERIILLGAVAGGGDPAAVAAAVDSRIAAVAPFNYGEATPENAGRAVWPAGLADPGWGSWESTRNLPRSIADQFMPWLVCASVAPRRFVFSYEMGWDAEKQPIWQRYRKVFGLYNALDNLDEAQGFGGFPGPGECTNIGASQRKTLYPELERWFGIPAPAQEPDDRRPESELLSYDPQLALTAANRPVHELAHEIARPRLASARSALSSLDAPARLNWLRREWTRRLGDMEPNPAPAITTHAPRTLNGATVEAITVESEPGIAVPMLLLNPTTATARRGVVIALSHAGKEGMWRGHHAELMKLVQQGFAVCLPDVRGIGETSPDLRRGPSTTETSQAATELMLGSSLLGRRVKDLRSVIAYLRTRPAIDTSRIAIWGDSEAPLNPQRLLLDEAPGWQIGPDVQQTADPLGGLLALFTALYEPGVRAIATRRNLASIESLLADPFAYLPGHVIVPDMLSAGDLNDIAAALPAAIWIESPIDARNRALTATQLESDFASLNAAAGSRIQVSGHAPAPNALTDWLIAQLRSAP